MARNSWTWAGGPITLGGLTITNPVVVLTAADMKVSGGFAVGGAVIMGTTFSLSGDAAATLLFQNGAPVLSSLTVSNVKAQAGNLVLTNNRSGVFAPVDQSAFILDRSYGVALGDLDNDGDLDAYVANSVANRCYRNDGRARFTLWGTDSRVDDSRGAAIADLNGDGWRDVVVANAWPGPGIVYLNRTNGVLEAFPLGADSSDGTGVVVADLNGDLRLDIAMSGWEDNTVWFGLDGTNFARSSQFLGGERGQAVAVGNINRLTAADLVYVHYDSTNTLWLNQCEP